MKKPGRSRSTEKEATRPPRGHGLTEQNAGSIVSLADTLIEELKQVQGLCELLNLTNEHESGEVTFVEARVIARVAALMDRSLEQTREGMEHLASLAADGMSQPGSKEKSAA